jgi:hypothetical protein
VNDNAPKCKCSVEKRTFRYENAKVPLLTRGTDLAPAKHIASLSTERIPKSLSRVLGAAQIRENWRERKRKLEEEGVGAGADRKRKEKKLKGLSVEESDRNPLAIQPGEALAHFNK